MNTSFIRQLVWRDNVPNTNEYPFCLPAVKHLDEINFETPVTFFVGENGTGKSTLVEAIAVNYGFNPEGGSRNFNFETAVTHSNLHKYIRLAKGVKRPSDGFFLRAESFYNVSSYIDELDKQVCSSPPIIDSYGGISLHNQSHGETFLTLVQERFSGNGLYILDEPEAALSPMRQMTLLCEIDNLVKKGSQLIVATHSPVLMAYPNSTIYSFSVDGVKKCHYEQTEHYQITKQFLNNYKGMLKTLLED